jgi:hypothetical protein
VYFTLLTQFYNQTKKQAWKYGEQGLHLRLHKLYERRQNIAVWLRLLYDRGRAIDDTTNQLGFLIGANLLIVGMILIKGCRMIRTESYIMISGVYQSWGLTTSFGDFGTCHCFP